MTVFTLSVVVWCLCVYAHVFLLDTFAKGSCAWTLRVALWYRAAGTARPACARCLLLAALADPYAYAYAALGCATLAVGAVTVHRPDVGLACHLTSVFVYLVAAVADRCHRRWWDREVVPRDR